MGTVTAPRYSLPCSYCVDGASFPGTEALKDHLLSNHKSLVTGRSAYSLAEENNASVTKSVNRAPSASVYLLKSEQSTDSGMVTPVRSSFTSSGASILSPSENRLGRFSTSQTNKYNEIEELTKENDKLKTALLEKDEGHKRLRQRWKKEAEDTIRHLKTNYDDVTSQKRLLERLLQESENEKNQIREHNHNLEKDHANLQTKVSVEKRNFLQNSDNTKLSTLTKELQDEKKHSKGLSDDLQSLKEDNNGLEASNGIKDKTIKELQIKLKAVQVDLIKEKQSCNDLYKERMSLKGQVAMLEVNAIKSESGHDLHRNKTASSDSLSSNKQDIQEQLVLYKNSVQRLSLEVKNLQEDKRKLIENLHNADNALSKLSFHVNKSPSQKSPSTSNFMDKEMRDSLSQILDVVRMIPSSDAVSSKQEITRLTSELQRVNIQLVDERANTMQLQQNITELEKYIENEAKDDSEETKRFTEYQILRSKHQKCVKNEKIRKQLRSEKKLLRRKLTDSQKQHQLLMVLFNSLKDEVQYKDKVIEDLHKERKKVDTENKNLLLSLQEIKSAVSQKDVELEKYKRESCYLLEKLNNTSEALEVLKNKNNQLEEKLKKIDDLDLLQTNLKQLQDSVLELSKDKSSSSDKNAAQSVELLIKRNMELSNEITELRQQLYDSSYTNGNLKEKIVELEEAKIALESQQKILQAELVQQPAPETETKEHESVIQEYQSQIENLLLEKEILSSRVLILEGIREEMELLRGEKNKLRQENSEIKKTLSTYLKTKSTTECIAKYDGQSDHGLILLNPMDACDTTHSEQLLEDVKTLDNLDEEDKSRLLEMLSMPEFQSFLSTKELVINLHEDHTATAATAASKSLRNLSSEDFEPEQLISHIYDGENGLSPVNSSSGSFEFVQRLHKINPTSQDRDETIDYVHAPDAHKIHEADGVTNHDSFTRKNLVFSKGGAESSKVDSSANRIKEWVQENNRNESSLFSAKNLDTSANNSISSLYTERGNLDSKKNLSVNSMMSDRKSLDKIVSESKLISNDIAYKGKQQGKVDYEKVLQEFGKVIESISSKERLDLERRDSLKSKQVKFSDHVVEVCKPKRGVDVASSSKSEEDAMYRSFFQDALKRNYPSLAQSDEDLELNHDSNSSLVSNTDTKESEGQTYDEEDRQKSQGLTEKAIKLMQSDPSMVNAMTGSGDFPLLQTAASPRPSTKSEGEDAFQQRNSSSSMFSMHMDTSAENLLQRLSSPFSNRPFKRFSSEHFNHEFKRIGVLPLISEQDITAKKHNASESMVDRTGSNKQPIEKEEPATRALDVLKSFISKAEQIKDSHEILETQLQLLDRENPVALASPERIEPENFGNDDVKVTVSPDIVNESAVAETLAEIVPVFNVVSRSDFEDSLNLRERPEMLSNTRLLTIPGYLASTPGVPSSMHPPASLDFSDASFHGLSLFADSQTEV